MQLTFRRWLLLVAALCGGVAVLALPFPPQRSEIIRTIDDNRLVTEQGRMRAVWQQLDSELRAYRVAEAQRRWLAFGARDTVAVYVDASVRAGDRGSVQATLLAAWKGLGPTASAARAAIYVYADTTSPLRRRIVAATQARGEMVYLVPTTNSQAGRCVVVIRIGQGGLSSLPTRLLGPCAYYAAFGLPGDPMREWLARSDYALSRMGDWSQPASGSRVSRYDAPSRMTDCLAAGQERCSAAVALGAAPLDRKSGPSAARRSMIRIVSESGFDAVGPFDFSVAEGGPLLGPAERRFLADMVRMYGEERFRAFWTSTESPERAFQAATGTSLASWTQEWMERSVTPAPARERWARVALWMAGALLLLFVVASRPRERVLFRLARSA